MDLIRQLIEPHAKARARRNSIEHVIDSNSRRRSLEILATETSRAGSESGDPVHNPLMEAFHARFREMDIAHDGRVVLEGFLIYFVNEDELELSAD